MNKWIFFKRQFLVSLFMMMTVHGWSENYSGYVGEYILLSPPETPSGTQLDSYNFIADDIYNLTVVGHTVCIEKYFEGRSRIRVDYWYTWDEKVGMTVVRKRSSTQTTYHYISCKVIELTGIPTDGLNMAVGESKTINWSCDPLSKSSYVRLNWKSSNSSVVSVNSYGELTANSEGEARITVENNAGPSKSFPVKVEKKQDGKPISISLPSSITIKVGETVLLTPSIYPEGAESTLSGVYNADGTIRLSYYNNNTQFLISGIKEGNSYVVAKTDNGLTSRCDITVSGYNPTAKGDGTRSNPYNAVGAFLHAASLPYNEATAERYYVKGKVLEIKEQFGTKYSNATFYLSDDGTIKNSFHIYRTNYLNNKFFEEGDDTLKVGDEVLIYGKMVFYYNDTNGYSFIPEMASNQSYIVSINGKGEQASEQDVIFSSAGYATFYSSESAYTLPNGLSAQVVTSVANGKLTYKTIADGSVSGIVPKGTAVMLVSDAKRAGTYTLTPTESSASYSGTNLLRGSDDATMTSGDGYHYKLSYGRSGSSLNNVFGWYWGAANGGSFQIDGHKAWLVVPKSSATRGYSIGDEATGISDVEADDADAHYYDLQGRSVSKPQRKGVYIKNGQRVIIK